MFYRPGIYYRAYFYNMKFSVLTIIISFSFLSACNSSRKVITNKVSLADLSDPDYSQTASWAALPWFHSPADSIPSFLKGTYKKDSLADVFYVHPTTFIDNKDERWNATLTDEKLNSRTDNLTLLYQASAFAEKCRVFAPRYRQAHIRAYYTVDKERAAAAFEEAYADVKSSFIYYLEHFNNGRPFIIASHSQGTTHAIRLLKEIVEGKPLQQKLICAYLLGMPVHEGYYTGIPVCNSPTQTGCFISWRTWKYGYEGNEYVKAEKFKAVVVNPLTWTTGTAYAPRYLNRGGLLKNYNKIIPGLTDAVVHGNILWSHKPKFFGNIFLTQKNYHIADVNLFYENIRENVAERINSYMGSQ